jgi:tetratricopeptide (TPR) repeat protein
MRQSTFQIVVIASSVLIFILLLSFGRTKPLNKKGDEAAAEDTIALNDEVLMAGARAKLDSAQLAYMTTLEQQLAQASQLEEEVLSLKLISRTWNEYGNFAAGGYFAEKVAKLKPSAESWSVAGTTYGIAFNREQQDFPLKKYVGHKAVQAFGKAIELAPDSISYRINEALMYVDLSMVDQTVMPMTGAQKMLSLDKEYPNNVKINLHLGRLSLNRTGDIKKAIPRFQNIIQIAEDSEVDKGILLEAHYSLVECFKKQENKEKVVYHYNQCISLAEGRPELEAELRRSKAAYEAAAQ